MNEELANLLIRITAVGFDEVLQSLREIEETANRVTSGGGFAKLQDTLDKISSSLDEFKDGMRSATGGFNAFSDGAKRSGTQMAAHTQALERNQNVLATLAKAYASFWVLFNAPRKFYATLDGVAQFNRQLTTMSVLANMSRESLIGLGAAAGAFGGSSSGIAGLASRSELAMQGFRMGQGGGAFEQAAQMYGLSLAGTGEGGLMQGGEALDNIVAAMEKLPDMADKRGLKSLLGIDDATFQLMLKGMAAWEQAKKDNAEYAERLAAAQEKTEAWNRATAELKKEWEVLKTQVFVDLAPHVVKIVNWVKELTKDSGRLHQAISAIYASVTAIGTAIAAWKVGKAVLGVTKLVAAFKTLRAVQAATSAAGAVGAAGAIGNIAGAVAGAANPVSAVAGVVGAVASAAQNQIQIHSLSVMEQHLATWHNEWRAFTIYANTGHTGRDGKGYAMSKEAFGRLLPGLGDDMKAVWQVAASNARKMKGYEYAVNEHEYGKRVRAAREVGGGGRATPQMNVTMHIGTVESSAENYEGLVKDLLGNAKDVVARRMEAADWFDSNSGVVVA